MATRFNINGLSKFSTFNKSCSTSNNNKIRLYMYGCATAAKHNRIHIRIFSYSPIFIYASNSCNVPLRNLKVKGAIIMMKNQCRLETNVLNKGRWLMPQRKRLMSISRYNYMYAITTETSFFTNSKVLSW